MYMYIHTYMSLSFSLSLYIYTYIYTYIYVYRSAEADNTGIFKGFCCSRGWRRENMVEVNMVLAEFDRFKHGLYKSCGIEFLRVLC